MMLFIYLLEHSRFSHVGACEKVASDLKLGGGFRRVHRLSLAITSHKNIFFPPGETVLLMINVFFNIRIYRQHILCIG